MSNIVLAFGEHIYVKELDSSSTTAGGIIIQDGSGGSADTMRCEVVSVSEKLSKRFAEENWKHPIQVGSIILKPFHVGTPRKVSTEEGLKNYWTVHIDSVLGLEL